MRDIKKGRRKMWKYFFAIVFIYVFSAGLLFGSDSSRVGNNKGPLLTNNLYPFYLPFINLLPENAKPLGQGNIRLSISNNYGNTFRLDGDGMADNFLFDVDTESSRTAINFDVGVTNKIDIGLEATYLIQYGGIFDSIIQKFHNFFGVPNAGRNEVENNQFALNVENKNGIWIDMNKPVSGFGDITLKAKFNLSELLKKSLYLSLQPAVKIPVGNSDYLLSSGKFDFALNLLAEKTGNNYGLYINLGWLHLSKPENLYIFEFTENLFSYVLSYEWIVGEDWSIYIQADGSSSPYKSGYHLLDDNSCTINLGFKYKLNENSLIQFAFSEELFTFAATDVSVILALVFNIGSIPGTGRGK